MIGAASLTELGKHGIYYIYLTRNPYIQEFD